MASLDFPALDVAYAFLILVPGFLSYEVARRTGRVPSTFDEFDKVAFSLMGSGVSLFVLLVVGVGTVVAALPLLLLAGTLTGGVGAVVAAIEANLNLVLGAGVILGYPIVLAIAGSVGYVAGQVSLARAKKRGDYRTAHGSLWREIRVKAGREQSRSDPGERRAYYVYVTTDAGRELYGSVEGMGQAEHGDLLLRHPYLVFRDRWGEILYHRKLGDSVYIQGAEIREVVFETVLPDIHEPVG